MRFSACKCYGRGKFSRIFHIRFYHNWLRFGIFKWIILCIFTLLDLWDFGSYYGILKSFHTCFIFLESLLRLHLGGHAQTYSNLRTLGNVKINHKVLATSVIDKYKTSWHCNVCCTILQHCQAVSIRCPQNVCVVC